MQPVVYMIALSCSAVLTIFALGFFATGKLDRVSFLIMLALAIAVGFGMVFGVKKFWLRFGTAEVGLDTYKDEIDTFTKIKLEEIQTDVNLHKQSITAILKDANEASERLSELEKSTTILITKAENQEADLRKLIEHARPPILNFKTGNSKRRGDGIGKVFRLFPDKNEPLGRTAILAQVIGDTNSKILRMECAGAAMVLESKTQITSDGKRAWKIFNPPVPIPLPMEIVVSEPCEISLEGTYVIKPNIINVELPSE